MRQLFPSAPAAVPLRRELPLYRDVDWDFERDAPVFSAGMPVMVEGERAVKVWCYHALKAIRYQNEAHSFAYGSELDRLVGQGWSEDTKKAEAVRYVTEALTVSPYVESVAVEDLAFREGRLSGLLDIKTMYGRVKIRV